MQLVKFIASDYLEGSKDYVQSTKHVWHSGCNIEHEVCRQILDKNIIIIRCDAFRLFREAFCDDIQQKEKLVKP